MINFYCPGFYENQVMYSQYLFLQREYPECFIENRNIHTIYGCFPEMIWNGGGNYFGEKLKGYNLIHKIFDWYLEHNLYLQFTFTNPCLTLEDTKDKYCNNILNIISEYNNINILVASEALDNYIRNKYPNIKIDKSIIATRKEQENYNFDCIIEDLKKYNQIVLPKIYLKNWDYLLNIPKEIRSKIEILINETCPIDCPYAYTHYLKYGQLQLYNDYDSIDTGCVQTDRFKDPFEYLRAEQNNAILKLSELSKYENNNFTSMKISGRLYPMTGIVQTLDYFIKPEYKKDVLIFLLTPFKNEQYNNFIFED